MSAGGELHMRATEELPDSVVRPYEYQQRMAAVMRDETIRDAMFEWFRQAGKSLGGAIGINDNVLTLEAQGRRAMWVLISRSLAQARELSLKVRNLARAIAAAKKILLPVRYSERDVHDADERSFELEYPGHSRVLCVSANPDAAAGYTSNLWWDEVGLTRKAHELFGTAFGITTRAGLRFLMTSTPRPGFWNQRWDDAGQPGSVIYREHMTIHDGIAQGCPLDAEAVRARLRDDLKWREDYLCEHVDDDLCWLPWELIVGATDARCSVALPDRDDPWWENVQASYGGWDVARWQNLSVLWLWHRVGGQLLTRGIIVMRRMPFEQQIERVRMAVGQCPRFARLCIDATGMGEMVAEQAQKRIGRVEAIKVTAPVKEVVAGDFRRLLEDRTGRLPDDDDVRADLHSVHRTMTAAGNPRFEGEAEGSHADRFWAAGFGLHGALDSGGGLTAADAEVLRRVARRHGREADGRPERPETRRRGARAGKGVW